jgi:hypothetical protein
MSACNIEGNVIYYKKPIPFGYIGVIQGIRVKSNGTLFFR